MLAPRQGQDSAPPPPQHLGPWAPPSRWHPRQPPTLPMLKAGPGFMDGITLSWSVLVCVSVQNQAYECAYVTRHLGECVRSRE